MRTGAREASWLLNKGLLRAVLRMEVWFALLVIDSSDDGRMLSSHSLQYLHNPVWFASPFKFLPQCGGTQPTDPSIPLWGQILSFNLASPRAALVLGFNPCRILQNKIHTFMQMALPIFDAKLSRENLVPYVSREPSLATNSRLFRFRLSAQYGRTPFKWSQFRYVDLIKAG